ncbi:MAG: ATP-binding protein [Atopobiaceae bacterium]
MKVITGIRRCGKSVLLFHLFKDRLLAEGVPADHIIEVALDRRGSEALRNPNLLYDHVLARVRDDGQYYVFIDEIQLSYRVKRDDVDERSVAPEDRDLLYTTFYDVLNDLLSRDNLDVYVTGSNSRMLSSDIVTNFRDRGSEIRVSPLSFSEYHAYKHGEKGDDWADYLLWGGMPTAVLEEDESERRRYLSGLFDTVYRADIIERYHVRNAYVLDALVNELASSVGSLTNPARLTKSLNSQMHARTTEPTVAKCLGALSDAFLFSEAKRWDVKGKRYFEFPSKWYATDLGLRNARLGFRQFERNHLMENAIYNELTHRGYPVDVGTVKMTSTRNGKTTQTTGEIDFVVNLGDRQVYIQSALTVDDPEKRTQEIRPLAKSGDFSEKIVVVDGNQRPWVDDKGIRYVGVIPFMLDPGLL